MNAGKLRHICDIYRPSEAQDDRGQEHGDVLLHKGVPCSVEPLNSRELEAARQVYSVATHTIRLYGDPKTPITHRHYLIVNGSRRFDIGEVVDLEQNGEQYKLTCGEVVA